jgi:hypothetical protein
MFGMGTLEPNLGFTTHRVTWSEACNMFVLQFPVVEEGQHVMEPRNQLACANSVHTFIVVICF